MILEVDSNFPQPGIVEHAVEILNKNRGILIYPTDTVYGLGCNAFDETAVNKVLTFKQRDPQKKLSLLFYSITEIKKYCDITKEQEEVLNTYLPGPYTFIVKAGSKLPASLIGPNNTVAVRIPRNKLCTALSKEIKAPLITTSLNISGEPIISNINQLSQTQINTIDIILDAGELSTIPSTIIDLTTTPFSVIRKGKGVWNDTLKIRNDN